MDPLSPPAVRGLHVSPDVERVCPAKKRRFFPFSPLRPMAAQPPGRPEAPFPHPGAFGRTPTSSAFGRFTR